MEMKETTKRKGYKRFSLRPPGESPQPTEDPTLT